MFPFGKKIPKDNLEDYRDITDDVVEGDFVPYACHWDPHTIITKNGEILQIIKITGFSYEQLSNDKDDEDSDLRSRIREAILENIDSTKYSIWIHTIRRKTSLKTEGDYKRDFSGYLNRFWNDKNDWEHKFSNEVFISIVCDDKQGSSILAADNFVRGIIPKFDLRHREKKIDEMRDELNEVVENMLPTLQRYGAYRLGVVKRGDIYYSEPCEFLGKLITMLDLEFPVKEVDLSHYLTDYDVTFGYNAAEVRMRSDGKRRFGTILTIREYKEISTQSLETLLNTNSEFIVAQFFEFIPAAEALKDYAYQKELFEISKADALSEKIGLSGIIASDKGKATDYGRHQLNIFILADSIRILENSVAKTVTSLTKLGMAPIREDIKLEENYWSQLPANFEFIRRFRPINTARIGGFANLSNYPAGKKTGHRWGNAVTTVYTAAKTPYFFNFHYGDNGHTLIAGKEDTGKTVLLNFLLAESRKFNGKLFYFDAGREAEIFIRSINGQYYNLSPQEQREYAKLDLDIIGNLNFAGDIFAFEVGDFAYNPEFTPILIKLLDNIIEKLDCYPAIIVFAEAWQILDNPIFAPLLSDFMDKLTIKNAIAIFATNNIDAAKSGKITKILAEKVATEIYLPDEESDDSYFEAFGLNEKECYYLSMMNSDDRHFLFKQGEDVVVAELNLHDMKDIIAILHADEDNLQIMEEEILANGLKAGDWMPKFLARV